MNKRERMLAICVALLVGTLSVQWFVKRVIQEPLSQKDVQLVALMDQVKTKQAELQRARDAEFDLRQWRDRALPGDVGLATALYQEFLHQSLARAGVERPSVSPSATMTHGDDYIQLPCMIRADCTLQQLSVFLNEFYSTDLMHQIRSLTITPRSQKGTAETFDVTMKVEALAMKDATAEDKLPGVEERDKPLPLPKEYTLFAAKNVFQPTRLEKVAPPRVARATPPPTVRDERGDYEVSMAREENGIGTVGFRNTKTKRETILDEGELLEIGGLTAKIADVKPPTVYLEVDGALASVRVGRTLNNLVMQETPAAQPPEVVAGRDDGERAQE